MTSPVCLYLGAPGECPECGGWSATGRRCSDACVESWLQRQAELAARDAARRHEEEVFGRAARRLLDLGFTEAETDQLLAGLT